MAAPSLQPGSWDTNLAHAIEKEGGFAAIGLSMEVVLSLFPVGSLWIWHDESTIPTGWELITDSADRFLKFLPTGGTLGDTGGANTHSHDDHVVTQPADHNVSGTTGTESAGIATHDDGGSLVNVSDDNHTHNYSFIVSHSGADVDAHSTADNVPEWYGVFLIRKVS